MKFQPILFNLGLTALFVSGCSSYTTYQSEIISDRVQVKMEAQLERETPEITHQNINLLGKTAAFFFVVKAGQAVQEADQKRLHTQTYQKIVKTNFYETCIADQQITVLLEKKLALNQLKKIYLESISSVAVSDKDISNPLGKALGADNFIIFQVDNWGASEAGQPDILKMKMRVVNSGSGDILWTALHIMENVSKQPGTLEEKVDFVANTLTENFYHRFQPKWHKQRFVNLAKI